jgi:hypothetical protein
MDSCSSYLGIKELKYTRLWTAAVAELVGVLFLTFVGCGSCIGGPEKGWQASDNPTIVEVKDVGYCSVLIIIHKSKRNRIKT